MIQFEKLFDRKNSFLLIAGPCAIEDENIAYEIASKIYEITEKLKINFVLRVDLKKRTEVELIVLLELVMKKP